ncbi:MAG TPA: hypothetical protein VIJ94_02670 [Caulobacteraceae bacterium]
MGDVDSVAALCCSLAGVCSGARAVKGGAAIGVPTGGAASPKPGNRPSLASPAALARAAVTIAGADIEADVCSAAALGSLLVEICNDTGVINGAAAICATAGAASAAPGFKAPC